jgi:hypothetical protein
MQTEGTGKPLSAEEFREALGKFLDVSPKARLGSKENPFIISNAAYDALISGDLGAEVIVTPGEPIQIRSIYMLIERDLNDSHT